MIEQPPNCDIQQIHVIHEPALEESHDPYVEIYMNIHKTGMKCEPLTIEVFPKEKKTKILQAGVLDPDEQKRFGLYASVVGRLSYNGP